MAAGPALPDVPRCSPAAGQPPSPAPPSARAPRLPRRPAPAPASPLPRGVAASLPHVTREQLRPESPGLTGGGEGGGAAEPPPPPRRGRVAPTRKARAGSWMDLRAPGGGAFLEPRGFSPVLPGTEPGSPGWPAGRGEAECPKGSLQTSAPAGGPDLPLRPRPSPPPPGPQLRPAGGRGVAGIGCGRSERLQKAPGFTS